MLERQLNESDHSGRVSHSHRVGTGGSSGGSARDAATSAEGEETRVADALDTQPSEPGGRKAEALRYITALGTRRDISAHALEPGFDGFNQNEHRA
jgi:hypothetical protein